MYKRQLLLRTFGSVYLVQCSLISVFKVLFIIVFCSGHMQQTKLGTRQSSDTRYGTHYETVCLLTSLTLHHTCSAVSALANGLSHFSSPHLSAYVSFYIDLYSVASQYSMLVCCHHIQTTYFLISQNYKPFFSTYSTPPLE